MSDDDTQTAPKTQVPDRLLRRCTCDGCWACKGQVLDCTCDIDWDAMYEARRGEW